MIQAKSYLDILSAVSESFKARTLVGPAALYQPYDPVLKAADVVSGQSFRNGAVLAAVSQIEGLEPDAQQTLRHKLRLGIFLIAGKTRPALQIERNTQLVFDAIRWTQDNTWGISGAAAPTSLRAQPLSDPALIEDNMHVWTLEWSQSFVFFDQQKEPEPDTSEQHYGAKRWSLGFDEREYA